MRIRGPISKLTCTADLGTDQDPKFQSDANSDQMIFPMDPKWFDRNSPMGNLESVQPLAFKKETYQQVHFVFKKNYN